MAIVQISRITNRKGLDTDLPQPLAGAELGWATDQRRLYIGNGELAEGAPVVGNTEILTQFSDILAVATAYTYQGTAAGYTVQTGVTAGSPVSQSVQDRLDSHCVITDFGATGDGVTDDTAAINRALNQLYCQTVNPQVRRSLFFPAGSYLISDTIAVPSYAMLHGEGTQSSILNFQVNAHTSTVAYNTGVLVSNGADYYRSVASVPAGISISNTLYWVLSALPACVVRTADSQQQTGVNIASNGAIPPTSIEISRMKIQTNQQAMGGLLIEACDSSRFSVDIAGPNTNAINSGLGNSTKALDFASTASLVCTHICIDDCRMSGFTWAVNTAQQLKSITISNCYFEKFYQGIYLGGATPVNGGATGVRMIGNIFDTIYLQGIVIDAVSRNVSAYNIFYNVGNNFNGDGFPASSIINITTANNLSLGDSFQRSTANSAVHARINLNNTSSIGYDNSYQIQQGTYVRQSGVSVTLLNNQTTTTVVTVDATRIRAFRVDYTIVRNNANVRTGTWTVVASTDGAGPPVTTDVGTQNSATGVTLAFTETASVVTFNYATTNTGQPATLNYSITKLA